MAARIQPITPEPPRHAKRPRVTDTAHLAFIRALPCVITLTRPVDPAHLRAGNRLLGKRHVGIAEKPDDRWAIPVTRRLHDQQHGMSEVEFWTLHGIPNPWQLALALFAASCDRDLETAESIIAEHHLMVLASEVPF